MLSVQIVGGLILLVMGGDFLVRGAVSLAARMRVSPLLVGLTLVGFGTSTPELVTSLQAAWRDAPGIAIGNVVGSNIANILLVLGLAALICPVHTTRGAFQRDGTVLCIASTICVAIMLAGSLSRTWGAACIALLAAYVFYTYLHERRVRDASARMHEAEAAAAPRGPARLWIALLLAFGGIALTVAGARFLVDGAVALTVAVGLSEAVVGLTIVAVGTSLPEAATSLVAAARRQSDVAFGNVVGSNIYNILGILGATALLKPIPVPAEIARLDIWVMCAATLLFVVFSMTGWRLSRIEGCIFIAGFVAYIAWRTVGAA